MKHVKWHDPMDQDLDGGRRHQRRERRQRFRWPERLDLNEDEADDEKDFRSWDVDWEDEDVLDIEPWSRRHWPG